MSNIVFIKQNSPEIRKKLKQAGFKVCACAAFEDAVWLNYHSDGRFQVSIHGVGHTDDAEGMFDLTPQERIDIWLNQEGYFPENRKFYNTVEDFLKVYPKPIKQE